MPLTETERKTGEEAPGVIMEEDDRSGEDAPQSGGTMVVKPRNDGGDRESSQKLKSSKELRRTLRHKEKQPSHTEQPPAKRIRFPKSGAGRTSKATGGRKAEPMDQKGRQEPLPILQKVNAVIEEIDKNS